MKNKRTHHMVLCALFAALIAVGAFIHIPMPLVPITLQTFFVILAGMLLGRRLGLTSVLIYIFMGLAGIPVFAEGGGLGYVLKPSFGYIVGFAAAAYVTGGIANKTARPAYRRLFASGFAGLGVIYLFGLVYYWLMSRFYLGSSIGLWPLVLHGFLITLPGDVAFMVPAAILAKRMIPFLKRD